MGMVLRVLLPTLGVLTLVAASPASAQIYVSRDAAGTLVLSDQPVQGAVSSYTVRNSTVRVTRQADSDIVSLYDEVIEEAAATHGVRPELVRAVIQVESGFNPRARSHKGAMGLMQLMPATAADLGVDNPWDPVQNIRGGVAYLGSLIQQFGDEVLALAAYNAGAGAARRWLPDAPMDVDLWVENIPFGETRNYVQRVLENLQVYRQLLKQSDSVKLAEDLKR